ncbi:3-hydroxyacyl-CoA dehydrogenase family protein [Corticibacter populi]|uniref:3-hydroxyacyl-CoA dehydrogenase family protein n=1 Tax=Corticibacter populi TaxID=1550736 RepID=A0A3M6QLB2_9BURK|nr:3-hydroxyacyl-CoA dehydrogenase NAD-binding domain-containing protein [Corticibacter populi]RMX03521.1 3-hydroxyacyl-CoA dehydrogenase family protein [Corticibacter populi]RZS29967.1 3-hydroxybutyryl-CoA dehydrogenase [Corticibacter populi]
MKEINNISVIGAGTMGHGIAEVFATGGYAVQVYEPHATVREKAGRAIQDELELLAEMGRIDAAAIPAILARIAFHDDLAVAVANSDFVIEAIPEDVTLKQELFARLDALCPAEAILASNTSSLSLPDMISTVRPERVSNCLTCHWYNPAHLIPLVELSDFGSSSAQTLEAVEALFRKVGKKTIRVLKDIPGLIANRIQQAIAREVFSLIEMKAASPEDIDNALKYGPAFRYATTGQLEIADFGGIDIWCTVGDNLLPLISAEQKASELLRQKIAENKLGLKSGEGFFVYDQAQRQAVTRDFHTRLIRQLAVSEQNQ